MHRFLFSTVLVFVLSFPLSANGQDAPTPTAIGLASAIYQMKTGNEDLTFRWRECGRFLTDDEARTRAGEYAQYFMNERGADPLFDPWVGAAMAMQESSFNRCVISREAGIQFHRAIQAEYGRDPTEADIRRLLSRPAWGRRLGMRGAFDAGIVQFRWPGREARLAGVTDASTLIDANVSIHLLALAMARYREACTTVDSYEGVHTVNRGDGTVRVFHFSVPCSEGYWVQHNSPSFFNYRYYHNVMRRHSQLVELSTNTEVMEEDIES